MTIWKFPLPTQDQFLIDMPVGSRVLSVQVQNGQPCIWALVDDNVAKTESRKFALRGTGHPCDGIANAAFVGTFQLFGGSLVFHLFDLGRP